MNYITLGITRILTLEMQLLTFAINEDILYRKFLIQDVLSLYRTLGTTMGCISLSLSWRPSFHT